MLMFRKEAKGKTLELRHQRTCDIFFDLHNDFEDPETPYVVDKQAKEQVYKLIETLLPKAVPTISDYGKTRFNLIELWADEEPRDGWVKVV